MREAAERTAKFEKARVERKVEVDAWYEQLKETDPAFYASIIAYRQQHGIPLPGGASALGSNTAHLNIYYEVPPKSSLKIVGSSDVDFSDAWKEPMPRKTVTLRATTNASGLTKVRGVFMGEHPGLSNGTVVIPCTVCAGTNQPVELACIPQEVLTLQKEDVDIVLVLTLKKKEGLPSGRYTGTIVFEISEQ